ncbi:MAG TPA: hypothetical protein VLY20_10870 [Nitrospiria bacterium]|nr:hypothetical protein [Nitrospiria bacterium]
MKITAMLLANAANSTGDGRINLLGAGFDQWPRKQFPSKAEVTVFLRIEILSTEAGTHAIALDLINGDGQEVIPRIQGMFTIPSGPPFYRYLNLTYNLRFEFPSPGEYSFRAVINGRDESSCPIRAVLIPAESVSEPPPQN